MFQGFTEQLTATVGGVAIPSAAIHHTGVIAMSISFKKAPTADVIALMRQLYGDPAAQDEKAFLYDDLRSLSTTGMTALANRAGQPVSAQIHRQDEIKTLSDGTQYVVTAHGWRKLQREGSDNGT